MTIAAVAWERATTTLHNGTKRRRKCFTGFERAPRIHNLFLTAIVSSLFDPGVLQRFLRYANGCRAINGPRRSSPLLSWIRHAAVPPGLLRLKTGMRPLAVS